jgi:hypothetical protein
VLVAAGTYYENVHSEVVNLTLVSESGPELTVIDGGGAGRCVYVDRSKLVKGFTLQNGDATLATWHTGQGGGIYAFWYGDLRNLILKGNHAKYGGGVCIIALSWQSYLVDCLIVGNTAMNSGGGVYVSGDGETDTDVAGCTVVGNGAPTGGNVYLDAALPFYGSASIYQCVVTNSSQGVGIYWGGQWGCPIVCCDVWNNAGGNYGGTCGDMTGTDGNISTDPLFCDPLSGNYTLDCNSPCLPGNHPDGWDCGLIGKYGVGCGPSAVEKTTWGAIKAMYR